MSSAFPCGTPSTMSNSTTSPNSLSPANKANVPPIWPAPTSAILLRAIGKFLAKRGRARRRGSYREFRGRARQPALDPGNSAELHPAVGEIVLALHLDKARCRALKFEGAVARDINLLGRHLGRSDEQGARLVQRIDQDVEALSLVSVACLEPLDLFDDN